MTLRTMPNLLDLRPADAAETAVAWRIAMERTDGPTWLSLTRQGVPPLDRTVLASAAEARKGAYVLADASGSAPGVVLIASGSEIGIALEAKEALEAEGIATRVVSMPSWYLFAQQDQAYRDLVLPPTVRARVALEAGSTFGWARWVGDAGGAVGVDHFGASAPAEALYERFGVTSEAVVAKARATLERMAGAGA